MHVIDEPESITLAVQCRQPGKVIGARLTALLKNCEFSDLELLTSPTLVLSIKFRMAKNNSAIFVL